MTGINTPQMVKLVSKPDGQNFIELKRSFSDILQIFWLFKSNITSRLRKLEPISEETKTSGAGRREGVDNPDEGDVNDTDPSEGNGNDTGNVGKHYPSSIDEIMAWYSAIEHLLSVLRLTTTVAAPRVLLQSEKKARLALQSKHKSTFWQHRRSVRVAYITE